MRNFNLAEAINWERLSRLGLILTIFLISFAWTIFEDFCTSYSIDFPFIHIENFVYSVCFSLEMSTLTSKCQWCWSWLISNLFNIISALIVMWIKYAETPSPQERFWKKKNDKNHAVHVPLSSSIRKTRDGMWPPL